MTFAQLFDLAFGNIGRFFKEIAFKKEERGKLSYGLVGTLILVLTYGLIMLFSASYSTGYYRFKGDIYHFIRPQVILAVVGLVLMYLISNINYRSLRHMNWYLYILTLLLLVWALFSEPYNGCYRWVYMFGTTLQPSELAKMAVIIAVSFILSKRQDEEGANPKAFKYIMILTGLVFILIAPENLSTAMLLFGVVCMMMFIGRVSAKKLFGMLGLLALVGGVAVGILMAIPAKTLHNTPGLHRFETWQNRVSGFFDKEEVPAAKFDIDKDAQIAHARIAIATSHVVGKGPGNSIQRDFLSQAFSDFIFAIVVEEMGLIGGIFVVFLYLWLLMRAGRIAQKCERTFPAFLVMGIALLLVSQAILNMMVAVGLFPVTGQPLPLVSKGGTSTLINCAYIGMILSVSRYTAHLEEQKEHDAQLQLQIETNAADSEAQAAAEPTAQILNSDAKFEDENDINKG